jgi:hypothetical protein
MAYEDITPQERVEFLEESLNFFREQLAACDPSRGWDSQRRYEKLITAINHTRTELVLARYEADWAAS